MRKFTAISIATFYLLLSTGMFINMINTDLFYFASLIKSSGHTLNINDTNCQDRKDCPYSMKNNASFRIKENIKPSVQEGIELCPQQVLSINIFEETASLEGFDSSIINAPVFYRSPVYIKICSLLI